MPEMVEAKRPMMTAWKVKLLGGLVSISGLAAAASATVDLNATIGPIIDSVTELIPSIVNLVVAILPAIIAMAVIGLIIGIFDGIISKLHF